jgi:hypothetical protein
MVQRDPDIATDGGTLPGGNIATIFRIVTQGILNADS